MAAQPCRPLESAVDVLRIVNRASLPELAAALGAMGDQDFPCPRCGKRAWAIDAWRWSCFQCRERGTIVEVAHAVASDPDAVTALMAAQEAA